MRIQSNGSPSKLYSSHYSVRLVPCTYRLRPHFGAGTVCNGWCGWYCSRSYHHWLENKEVEHTYYLGAFTGAYRANTEGIPRTPSPSSKPSWAKKRAQNVQEKKRKIDELKERSRKGLKRLMHHPQGWQRRDILAMRLQVLVKPDDSWPSSQQQASKELTEVLKKVGCLRRALRAVGWMPLFEMWTTKRAEWACNSHPGKRAQARTATWTKFSSCK